MDQIIAILALITGWGLNELSQLFRSSRQHKAAIANALSILLEARFEAVYIENMIPILKKHGVHGELVFCHNSS